MNVGGVHVGLRPGKDGSVVIGPVFGADARRKGAKDAVDQFGEELDTNQGRQKAIGQIEGRLGTLASGSGLERKRARELQEVAEKLKEGAGVQKTYGPVDEASDSDGGPQDSKFDTVNEDW